MTTRLRQISDVLAGRPLCWFGTRGLDAAPLARVGRLAVVSSQIAPLGAGELHAEEDCLELRVGARYDLDRYDIDLDPSPKAKGLKTRFLENARAPCVVVAYRPADFLTGPSFCEPDLISAFNFHIFQRQFEHKPWVELNVRKAAPELAILPTAFVRDTDHERIRELTASGPMVGRTSRGSGGAGVFVFATEQEFSERLPDHSDGFIGVAPYLAKALPLNVNGCVYNDGGVVGFAPSFQLVSVRGLTSRRFGFCGNDFAAASELDREAHEEIEKAVQGVGRWLHQTGYRGIFGLDLLWDDGVLYLIELNARFQASTVLSSAIAQACGAPDPATEHVAAFLGMSRPADVNVVSQARLATTMLGAGPVAQVIHRNTMVDPVYLDEPPQPTPGGAIEGATPRDMPVEAEAMLFRSLHSRSVTSTGYAVNDAVSDMIRATRKGF